MTDLDPDIASRLRHTAEGLVPVVVQQHDTGEVLMLAWADDEEEPVAPPAISKAPPPAIQPGALKLAPFQPSP